MCLFTPYHLEGECYAERKHGTNKALTREKYVSSYYNKRQQGSKDFKKSFKQELKEIGATDI